ncbi:MAG: DUF2945 domain-containing protein [Planctomycetota bacterium]
MAEGYNVGSKVKWKWGSGWGHGVVNERFTEKVTKTVKGSEITRDASSEEPAYLIEQEDGDQVLKSHSEVQKDS